MNGCTLIDEFRDLPRFCERRRHEKEQEREVMRSRQMKKRERAPTHSSRLLASLAQGQRYTWAELTAAAVAVGVTACSAQNVIFSLIKRGRLTAHRRIGFARGAIYTLNPED